jgi:exonuclease III
VTFIYFLRNLEFVIQNLPSKRKKLILCGDWNINFMKESAKLHDIKNILLMYNLINIVMTPTTITENTKSLLDVIIINKENHINPAAVLDFGFSDHQAQILCILVANPKSGLVKVRKRQFTVGGREEFKYLLVKES